MSTASAAMASYTEIKPVGTFATFVSRASGAPMAARSRNAVVVTMDEPLRRALATELRAMRWTVREASGAAEMFARLEQEPAAAVLVDSWLPDLEVRECVREVSRQFPLLDVLTTDGSDVGAPPPRGGFRGEVLHALRQAQKQVQEVFPGQAQACTDAPVWKNSLPAQEILQRHREIPAAPREFAAEAGAAAIRPVAVVPPPVAVHAAAASSAALQPGNGAGKQDTAGLPEFVGCDPRLLEVSRRIQLVAHRRTAVLVHGPTGTGKELVARAIHRLSGRQRFVAINCAAIPEALIEAELFGYARGAFTGAVQSRTGRIEAAAGGTLFLDEIGELPLPVQSKLLRYLECGEVQRVGENEAVRVDARVIVATHRKLGAMAAEGTFRLDLLHRLSVFLIQTPPLAGRYDDIDTLLAHTLANLAAQEPQTISQKVQNLRGDQRGDQGGDRRDGAKQLSAEARRKLHAHPWPGNVRELEHTLERAWILSGESAVIGEECVDFGEALL